MPDRPETNLGWSKPLRSISVKFGLELQPAFGGDFLFQERSAFPKNRAALGANL
ncbi:hypothetical protein B4135_3688 [Caldibacillus debilis]|uniref:Uncharacterized protein n=1 Tax=Caldibacillus debilis TaxID=301148 RepID=A0A150LAQ9_9BACI|nr:hypothetical protein B4135_3688 [Caldibacillus debilis]